MANGTPESEFSIECFQNYSAPEVFIQGLAGIVNQTDVETMIRAQKQMLQRFEKTNEMLTNCNALSASRLKLAGVEFKKHTQLLLDMKKDLDYIFKKIRALKAKLSTQYPEAFEAAQKASLAKACLEEDEMDESETHHLPALCKDMSKSTETLRPSVSQVFVKPPDAEEARPVEQPVQDKSSNISIPSNMHTDQPMDTTSSSEDNKLAVGERKDTGKVNHNSSASSSSDNTNSCSSGDCTSDTG